MKNLKGLTVAMMVGLCVGSMSSRIHAVKALQITEVGTSAEMYGLGGVESFNKSAFTVFENPAALHQIDKFSVGLFSTQIISEVDFRNIAYAQKTKYGTFGLGYMQAISSGFPLTVETSSHTFAEVGSFSVDFGVAKLAYQNTYKKYDLNYGVALDYYTNKIATVNGTGMNIDLGLMKTFGKFEGSISLKNAIPGAKVKWDTGSEELPYQLVFGGKYEWHDFEFMAQLNQHESYGRMLKATAVQYAPSILPFIQLRVGYREFMELGKTASGTTFGIGLRFKGLGFDYAFEKSNHPLVDNHNYFSVKLNF